MKKIDKETTQQEFAKYENRIKGWACVDSKAGVVGVFETREEARQNVRYAKTFGHKQIVAKLVFDEFVR